MNTANSFSVVFTVDNTPQEVFAAINNPRGWWSQAIEGATDKLGAEFNYHYQDLHRAAFKITEFVPDKKVVWHVQDNFFSFIKDKEEWLNTDVVFEITSQGDQTELRFTHVGLVPAYECFELCSNAWGTYVSKSLRDLITTGAGQPNPIEAVVSQARQMRSDNYAATFIVPQTPAEVFAAVNNVRGWWSEQIEGDTDKAGAEFVFHAKDMHRSTQKITEFVPDKKVVWRVLDSQLSYVQDGAEWQDTDVTFEIIENNGNTEVRFTHVGLVPAFECYDICSNAWDFYIKQSLFDLITTGTGQPTRKAAAA